MAHKLQLDVEKYRMGVVHVQTGEQYRPVMVVEITEDCSGPNYRPPVILVYGQVAQEILVQFREDGQRGVSWTVKQLEHELGIKEDLSAFGTRAKLLGMKRQRLWEIIVDNAPAA